MTTKPRDPWKVWWAFLALGLTSIIANAGDQGKVLSLKEGIELSVVREVDPKTREESYVCTILNTTSAPVPFEMKSASMGFRFRLLGKRGHEIPPTREWASMHVADDRAAGSRRDMLMAPRDGLIFRLSLPEAYGPDWTFGERLIVEWRVGTLMFVPPNPIGDGVSVEVKLRDPLQQQPTGQKTEGEPQVPDQPRELNGDNNAATNPAGGDAMPTPPPTSRRVTSFRSGALVLLALGGILVIALAIVRKRRSKSDLHPRGK